MSSLSEQGGMQSDAMVDSMPGDQMEPEENILPPKSDNIGLLTAASSASHHKESHEMST